MRLVASVLLFVLVGCNSTRQAANLVDSQSPGVAQGAGATVIGPTNSQTQTIQVADRKITYQPYIHPDLLGVRANVPGQQPVSTQPGTSPTATITVPMITTVTEHAETTIGSHQDASVLIKAATGIGAWGKARWVGICIFLFGAFGLAWSHNNPEGYPLVCWKFLAIGTALIIFDPSPWWLTALILPAGFYAVQKIKPFLP